MFCQFFWTSNFIVVFVLPNTNISLQAWFHNVAVVNYSRTWTSIPVFWHIPLKNTQKLFNVLCFPLSYINSKMFTLIWYHSNIKRISNPLITLLPLPENCHLYKRGKKKKPSALATEWKCYHFCFSIFNRLLLSIIYHKL